MNELISCVICNQPGLLRLDMHPHQIEHHGRGGRSRFCALPPRDIVHAAPPKKSAYLPYPYGRAACTCDTRERAS